VSASCNAGPQRVGNDLIGAKRRCEVAFGLFTRRGNVVEKLRIDLKDFGHAAAKLDKGNARVGMNEQIDGIIAPSLGGIHVDLNQRSGKSRCIVAGLVAAQARTDHNHEVGAVINRLGFGCHVVGAKTTAVILRHHRASIRAGHYGKTALGEIAGRGSRFAAAAAEPQHGPPCRPNELGQLVHQGRLWRLRRDRRKRDPARTHSLLTLDIDWDFQRHRAARRGERSARGCLDHGQGGARLPYPEITLGDGAQRVRLAGNVVDRGAVAIHMRPVDLRGDMQNRGARGERLKLRAGSVRRRGPGAGDDNTKRTAHARIGIGHVHGPGLAARRNETNTALARHGVENRHVMDGDDAKGGGNADLGEHIGNEVADGGCRSHYRSLRYTARCRRKSQSARR
jgi:hypothetical protein